MKIRRLLLPAALAGTCLLSLGACALSLASLFILLSKHHESAASAPIRWSQIESSDAVRYAENLRAIGCPAPTIQAILGQTATENSPAASSATAQTQAPSDPAVTTTAVSTPTPVAPSSVQAQSVAEQDNVTLAAQARRQAEIQSYVAASNPAPSYNPPAPASAETSYASITGSSSDTDSANAAPSGRSLPASYAQESGSGSTASPGYASGGAAATGPIQTIVAPDANSPIPAAFMDAPPSTHLNEAQAHQLDQIQQQFADKVSSSSQNPNSPKDPVGQPGASPANPAGSQPTPGSPTAQNWNSATSMSDQQFRAQFGTQAFLARERQDNMHQGAPAQ